MGRDRYLVSGDIAPFPVPARLVPPTPSTVPTPTPALAQTGKKRSKKVHAATPALVPSSPSRSTATPALSPSPTLRPTPAQAAPPVKIRIPRLNVTRSIVPLPRTRDRRTGAATWDTARLFRSGRQDLVGHAEGSANPGEQGNMILVGHNYGYGYTGAFVALGRLRPGNQVQVVNQDGQAFAYRITTVKRVAWRLKSFGELTQHLNYLAIGGPERLTLVSCSGAELEPFPERIYVVAEPVK
jgi:hypothetical protein